MRTHGLVLVLAGSLVGACFDDPDEGGDGAGTGDASTSTAGQDATSSASTGATGDATTDATGDPDDSTGADACGNGRMDPGEACDDGNNESGDGCEADCTLGPGAVVWSTTFDRMGGDDRVHGIAVDAAGNVFVAGIVTVPGQGFDAFLRKYPPDGRRLSWQHEIDSNAGEDVFNGVAVDSVGDVVAVGWIEGDFHLVHKYSADGDLLWNVSNDQGRVAHDVEIDGADNVVVAGALYDAAGIVGWQLTGTKYTSAGGSVWTAFENGDNASIDVGYGLGLDLEGNAYIAGVHDPPNQAWYVQQTAATGAQTFELGLTFATMQSYAFDVAVDGDGAATVAAGGDADGWLVRIQPGGQIPWTYQFDGGVGRDELRAVAAAPNDTIVAGGYRTVNGLDTEAVVLGLDQSGAVLWEVVFDGEGADVVAAMTVDADGFIYVGGHVDGPNGHDAWFAKLQG